MVFECFILRCSMLQPLLKSIQKYFIVWSAAKQGCLQNSLWREKVWLFKFMNSCKTISYPPSRTASLILFKFCSWNLSFPNAPWVSFGRFMTVWVTWGSESPLYPLLWNKLHTNNPWCACRLEIQNTNHMLMLNDSWHPCTLYLFHCHQQ